MTYLLFVMLTQRVFSSHLSPLCPVWVAGVEYNDVLQPNEGSGQ